MTKPVGYMYADLETRKLLLQVEPQGFNIIPGPLCGRVIKCHPVASSKAQKSGLFLERQKKSTAH